MTDWSDIDRLRRLRAEQQARRIAEALVLGNDLPRPSRLSAAVLNAAPAPAPPPTGLFGSGSTALGRLGSAGTPSDSTLLTDILTEPYRRRTEWEARFTHWERSESDAETRRIERGRNMVQRALARNEWLNEQGVRLEPQGSFTNRTNTRLDADIDLRVQHPHIKIDFAPDVNSQAAWGALGYQGIGTPLERLVPDMRFVIERDLVWEFGRRAVEPGKKAVRVRGLEGSRGEVDVVPTVTYHRITRSLTSTSFITTCGVAILSTDGSWTINYPDQHLANGRAKRLSTGRQFKRVVRIVKRLRTDMVHRGIIRTKVPSFLVECLVYNIADEHFTVPGDDRYARVKRVLTEIHRKLNGGILAPYLMMEVNGIKHLFCDGQAWTVQEAQNFVRLAIAHLGEG
jgi:hypothetical protein